MDRRFIFIIVSIAILLLLLRVILTMCFQPKMKEKFILISIHDTNPYYQSQIYKFLDELEKRNISKFSILITPYWDETSNINKHPYFVNKLKSKETAGAELILHGYDHKGNKFIDLNKSQAEKRLNKALDSFQQAFNSTPNGFIPPMWKQSNDTYELLKEKNFRFTETFTELEFFSGRRFKGFPLGMESYSSNKYIKYDRITPLIAKIFSNVYARLIWNKGGVVRYFIHPREADNGNYNATLNLLDKFLEKGWIPITYSELEDINITKV